MLISPKPPPAHSIEDAMEYSPSKTAKRSSMKDKQPLTLEEEELLKRHFSWKIGELCSGGLGMPEQVTATAMVFFQRFFLSNSVMVYDPSYMM
jgi:hypothetical protein